MCDASSVTTSSGAKKSAPKKPSASESVKTGSKFDKGEKDKSLDALMALNMSELKSICKDVGVADTSGLTKDLARRIFEHQSLPRTDADVDIRILNAAEFQATMHASGSSSAIPVAPVSPSPVAQVGLRGSPFRKLARKRGVEDQLPHVGFLPSFADVPSAEIPPPTIPSDDKVDAMFTFMRENMVTKADLMQLQRQIEERTKSYVDSVVSAVTREFTLTTQTVVDLCNRVDKLEAADRRRTASVPPTMGSRSSGDVVFKQIAFKKIPDGISADQRVKAIEEFMATNFEGIRVKDCFNVRTGPFPTDRAKERALAAVSIVEVSNSDIQRAVLQKIKSQNLKCTIGGTMVEVKAAMTAAASARNSALRRAERVLKEDDAIDAAKVKIEWTGSRGVTVDKIYAFVQENADVTGKFVKPFERFVLPS